MDRQMKLCIQEVHINAITAQLHQLQLQMAAQGFAMNMQIMGSVGNNNT